MKTYTFFLLEKYLESGTAPVYHWTDVHTAHKILDSNKIGDATYDHPDWTPHKPEPILRKGYFSVTRDPRYRKGHVGFELDYGKIKYRHKTKKYADPMVAKDNSGELIDKQNVRRWESEELINGPIDLNKHLRKIHITQHAYNKLIKERTAHVHSIKRQRTNIKLFDQKKFIPDKNNKFYKDDNTPVDIPVKALETGRITKQGYKNYIKNSAHYIKQINKLIKHPKLNIVDK